MKPSEHKFGVDGLGHVENKFERVWLDPDPLGLDRVYIQAKRYDPGRAVPIRDVRAFLGLENQIGPSTVSSSPPPPAFRAKPTTWLTELRNALPWSTG